MLVTRKKLCREGDVGGGDNYEGKRADLVKEESSSPEAQIYSLVKLFEYRLTLKEDVQSLILKKTTQEGGGDDLGATNQGEKVGMVGVAHSD